MTKLLQLKIIILTTPQSWETQIKEIQIIDLEVIHSISPILKRSISEGTIAEYRIIFMTTSMKIISNILKIHKMIIEFRQRLPIYKLN
jgi:hypothetical protein